MAALRCHFFAGLLACMFGCGCANFVFVPPIKRDVTVNGKTHKGFVLEFYKDGNKEASQHIKFECIKESGGKVVSFKRGDVNVMLDTHTGPSDVWGSSFWASPQKSWINSDTGKDWPPPPALTEANYSADVDEAGMSVTLTGPEVVGLGIRMVKKFTVDQTMGAIVHEYSIEATSGDLKDRTFAPWINTVVPVKGVTFYKQGPTPRKTVFAELPVEEENGYTWFEGDHPESTAHKLLSSTSRGWLGHLMPGSENGEDLLFVQKFQKIEASDAAPNEAQVQIFALDDYVQLELQGADKPITSGSPLRWTVLWFLEPLPEGTSSCSKYPCKEGRTALVDYVEKSFTSPHISPAMFISPINRPVVLNGKVYQGFVLEWKKDGIYTTFECIKEDAGKIVGFKLDGVNVMLDTHTGPSDVWGSSFWPSPQKSWEKSSTGKDWPPPPAVTDSEYTATADEASMSVTLTGPVIKGLGIRLKKTFRVDLKLDAIVQEYSIETTFDFHSDWTGTRPHQYFAPWINTVVPMKGLTVFKRHDGVTGEGTLESSQFTMLPVTEKDGYIWFAGDHPSATAYKLLANTSRGWLAHMDGDLAFTQEFQPTQQKAPNEAQVQIFALDDYVQLELQGEYTKITKSAPLTWQVVWFLRYLPDKLEPAIGSAMLTQFFDELVPADRVVDPPDVTPQESGSSSWGLGHWALIFAALGVLLAIIFYFMKGNSTQGPTNDAARQLNSANKDMEMSAQRSGGGERY